MILVRIPLMRLFHSMSVIFHILISVAFVEDNATNVMSSKPYCENHVRCFAQNRRK